MAGELGVDGDGAVDFAALAHEAAERELDLGLVRIGREPREHLGGAIEAVVDQVIEAREVVDVARAVGGRAPSDDRARTPPPR